MKDAYIYNMAMAELLRKREVEENHLKARPDSEISQSRIERCDKEINELHSMILEAERLGI